MKKVLYQSILFIAFTAITLSASAQNQMYVKWNGASGSVSTEQVVNWLKKAMTGSPISGAEVRCNANSYIAVWGQDLYNEILSAPMSSFSQGTSAGNEINYAVDHGQAVRLPGNLGPDVIVINFTRSNGETITIAKWGTNGCLNALQVPTQPKHIVEESDGDNTEYTVKRKEPAIQNTPSNNQQVTVVTPQADESWEKGMIKYNAGKDARTIAMYEDADLFTKIQSSGNSGTPQASSIGASTTLYVQPQGNGGGGGNNYPSDITVHNRLNATDWINAGANVANTVFNGVNTFRGIRMEDPNFGRSTNNYNYSYNDRRGYYTGGQGNNGGNNNSNNRPWPAGTNLDSNGDLPNNHFDDGTGVRRGSHPYSYNASTGNAYRTGNVYRTDNGGGTGGGTNNYGGSGVNQSSGGGMFNDGGGVRR